MKMRRVLTMLFIGALMVLACAGFGGCASTGTTTTTPQSTVYAAKNQFDLGLSFAVWYTHTLPLCPTGAPLCHTQVLADKITLAANEANKAIQSAEDIVRTPGYDPLSASGLQLAATQALTTLLQIVVDIETQNPALAGAAPKS